MNNTTTRNKVWTFCVIYLGYMLLFADRTVFTVSYTHLTLPTICSV